MIGLKSAVLHGQVVKNFGRGMVTLFTRREARIAGLTDERLDWAVQRGKYIRMERGVYFKADRPPNEFERRLAMAMRSTKPVRGELAAALHGFDGFDAPDDGSYGNIPTAEVFETLLAIAATTSDILWEQALEWCLRKRMITITDVEEALKTHRRGNGRIRRVLNLRPHNAPPTGSVLETLTVQLIRRNPLLPTPERQVNVRHWFVDLAWPERGVFLELDGEWHKDQPRYDAVRQTGVVAATGWLVGRYNWSEVVYQPNVTLRSIGELLTTAACLRN